MKILLPAIIVSLGLLSLLYRALCAWAQKNMRDTMYGEGQTPGNTPVVDSAQTDLSCTTLQDVTLRVNDKLPSPF